MSKTVNLSDLRPLLRGWLRSGLVHDGDDCGARLATVPGTACELRRGHEGNHMVRMTGGSFGWAREKRKGPRVGA